MQVSRAEETYVTQLLARTMHRAWCAHNGHKPRPWPYSDPGSQDYARIAVRYLGYEPSSIKDLEDDLVEAGDTL